MRNAIQKPAQNVQMGGGAAASVLLRGFLYGLAPHDPLTIAIVLVLMVATVAFVAWLPARRATKLDPIATLRVE